MVKIEEITRQLNANAQAMRALLQTLPEEQAEWKPGPEIWSLKEVMQHVYNEERLDFRKLLREMLKDPPSTWEKIVREEPVAVESCRKALEDFLLERSASIEWLESLQSPNWDIVLQAPWGVLSAGDVLHSWVEHDFLHLRQMIEVFYALSEQQAAPYSVEYAGGW